MYYPLLHRAVGCGLALAAIAEKGGTRGVRYSDNHEPKTQNAGAASSLATRR